MDVDKFMKILTKEKSIIGGIDHTITGTLLLANISWPSIINS